VKLFLVYAYGINFLRLLYPCTKKLELAKKNIDDKIIQELLIHNLGEIKNA